MKTFWLFALIFIPFTWFIIRALRFTDETIGKRSPVYSVQSYRISSLQHFGTLVHILLGVVVVMMLATARLLLPEIPRQPSVLIVLLGVLAIIAVPCFFYYVDWQYWKLVRDKTITLNPETSSIQVDNGISQVALTPATLMRIEQHIKRTTSTRDPLGLYGYYVFYPVSVPPVVLSNTYFLHNEFLDRYFKEVPQTQIEHKIPWPPTAEL